MAVPLGTASPCWQGVENHFKVVKKGDKYEFFAGTASGKPIPDSDSQEGDSDGDSDGAGDEVASVPVPPSTDTQAKKKGKRAQDKASDQDKADEAGPSGVQAGRRVKKGRK